MLKKWRSLSLFLMLCMGSSYANMHPCPGGFGVEGEYLYLLPSIDDTYFVLNSPISTPTFPNGKRENNDFHYHSGFRVGAGYAFCGCDLELWGYFTRLSTKTTKTVNGSFLWGTIGVPDFNSNFQNYPGSAFSDLRVLYYRVDGFLLPKVLCDWCGLDLYFLTGLEYAYIRLRENYEYVNNEIDEIPVIGTIRGGSRTWGIGPQFGLEFDYRFFRFASSRCLRSLSLVATGTASVLVSQAHRNETDIVSGEGILLDVSDKKEWRAFPALHAKIGLNWATYFSCWAGSVEIGYEFSSYFHALNRQIFTEMATGASLTNNLNFDVHGLYVAATLSF